MKNKRMKLISFFILFVFLFILGDGGGGGWVAELLMFGVSLWISEPAPHKNKNSIKKTEWGWEPVLSIFLVLSYLLMFLNLLLKW